MKLLAVDVAYQSAKAVVAGVLFRDWGDESGEAVFISELQEVPDYVSGAFYQRELPCILKLLKDHQLDPGCIVVDGYVYLDGVARAGLGKYLYDALQARVSVIGVAKKPFKGIPSQCELFRGCSTKPLFITAAGLDLTQAKYCIANMHGPYRLPTLLKEVDRLCRG